MDNLGKAYGQPPTVSTLFRASTSEAGSPAGSLFLREKEKIFFSSRFIETPLETPHGGFKGGIYYQ